MQSEHKIITSLLFENESAHYRTLVFLSFENLNEFNRLLKGSESNRQHWLVGNVSTAMGNLRNLNSKIIGLFYWKFWDILKVTFFFVQK